MKLVEQSLVHRTHSFDVTVFGRFSEFVESQNPSPKHTNQDIDSLSVLFPVCRGDTWHHALSYARAHILHPLELAPHSPSFRVAGTKPHLAIPKLDLVFQRDS